MADKDVLPFDSSRRFIGSYTANMAVVQILHDIFRSAWGEDQLVAAREGLHQHALDARLDADEALSFETWWNGLFDSLPISGNGGVPDHEVFPKAVHPLIGRAIVDPGVFKANQFEWFAQTGKARTRAPSSNAGGRRTIAADLNEQDDRPSQAGTSRGRANSNASRRSGGGSSFGDLSDDGDDDDEPEREQEQEQQGGRRGTTGPGDNTLAAIARAQGGQRQQHPLPPKPSSGSDHGRRTGPRSDGGRSSTSRNGGFSSRFEYRSEHDDPSRRSGGGRREDDERRTLLSRIGPVAADPPNGGYAAAIRASLSDKPRSRLESALPRWVQVLRAAVLQRRMDFRRKEYKVDLLDGWQVLAEQYKVQLADVQRIALGEYVDLSAIRDYEPESSFDVDDALIDLFRYKEEKKRPSRSPVDALLWAKYFDIWTDVYLGANLLVGYAHERQEDVYFYKEFIERALQRAAPHERSRVLRYDEAVRREILLGGTDARLRYFGECALNDPLYLAIVLHPSASSSSHEHRSNRPRTDDSATLFRYDRNDPTCGRYNHEEPCGKDCTRDHLCSHCGKEHRVIHCPTAPASAKASKGPAQPRRGGQRVNGGGGSGGNGNGGGAAGGGRLFGGAVAAVQPNRQ